MKAFNERLLEKLVCPATRTRLRYDAEAQDLVSEEAGLAYPIRDGTPVLLIDEARRVQGTEAGGPSFPGEGRAPAALDSGPRPPPGNSSDT